MCYTVQQVKGQTDQYKALPSVDEPMLQALLNTQDKAVVSGFEFPTLTVLTAAQAQTMVWGFIPHWTKAQPLKDLKTKRTQLLNARSETLFELSSFKHAAAQTRCVLPVNGFVEWQTVENRKYPYFIQHNQLPFLSLAGIYDTWRNAQGLMMYTFSIVTVEANPLMARIHNTKQRMPLILPENAIPTWLNQNTPISSLNQLMIPFPEVDMQAHTVKPLVRLHSSTELRQPYAYPELNLLF